jgi:hypothetical protein
MKSNATMAMFSCSDLQDISNIFKQRFKIEAKAFNVRKAFEEVINIQKLHSEMK